LRDFYDVYVVRIVIIDNARGRAIAWLKTFGDLVIAVDEKISGASEPANLLTEWGRPQREANEDLL
jgi:hypothetical protein